MHVNKKVPKAFLECRAYACSACGVDVSPAWAFGIIEQTDWSPRSRKEVAMIYEAAGAGRATTKAENAQTVMIFPTGAAVPVLCRRCWRKGLKVTKATRARRNRAAIIARRK